MLTPNEVKATEEGTTAPQAKPVEVGNWMIQKEKLKRKFDLTDADLAFQKGKKGEMLAKLQIKIHKSKEELQAIIAAL